ncbi:MAG: asparagine synthase-related protein [Saprospiraceae bacterium]
MFFYLNHSFTSPEPLTICFLGEKESDISLTTNTLYIKIGVQRIESLELQQGKLILLGDPIFNNRETLKNVISHGKLQENKLYEAVRGHYYWFFIRPEAVECGSAFGAIYPIYYHRGPAGVALSSSAFYLAEQTGTVQLDQRNLLERLLFNYPFFNSTWWQEIKLLPTHRHLAIYKDQVNIAGDFEIFDYFGDGNDASAKTLEHLAEVFQQETQLFLPDNEEFGVSLTGGFDGRTLVAAARKAGRNFTVFCYGRSGSSDLVYSEYLAKKLKLPHFAVRLDADYLVKISQPSARRFMSLTEYNGNWGRPHYDYAAQLLSQQFNYILTGNFGSELFRALHSNGPVMSSCLTALFSNNYAGWKDYLQQVTYSWHPTLFQNELESLISDLENYLAKLKHLEPNQQFYYFVYNELFRKYFGAEIVMQRHYLNNRTPYLNFNLTQALNKTIWSGVHSAIFEKNLLKRRKGQIFYATFLRQSDPILYHLKTNKGYRPADLLESWRAPFLIGGGIYQKYVKKPENDAHAVAAFFREYHVKIAEPILQNGASPFIKDQLHQSLQDIREGKDLKKWIQFYSIVSGWAAAGAKTTSAKYDTVITKSK